LPGAPLSSLPDGSDVFLDANIFVYALCGRSDDCRRLLERCAQEELFGVTTLDVVSEATHRLMLADACAKGIITRETVQELRNRLAEISGLSQYWVQASSILSMNIIVLRTEEAWHHQAHSVRASHGLLTNDSLIVATMREHGLSLLASADGDFDHIPSLVRYGPQDLT
jgi:predicted nucleic acid-binding protein